MRHRVNLLTHTHDTIVANKNNIMFNPQTNNMRNLISLPSPGIAVLVKYAEEKLSLTEHEDQILIDRLRKE